MNGIIDSASGQRLSALLALRRTLADAEKGQVIEQLSRFFLATPYLANRLIGSASMAEQLVIDLCQLDCLTYLEYVEALRHASSEASLLENLVQTRYRNGNITFAHRRHFFSDWAYCERVIADDVTASLSQHSVTVLKQLNQKADGTLYLPGVAVVERPVTYLPSEWIDQQVINQLNNGDYIGIYTPLAGLDVTHTGFFIVSEQGTLLRHASSRQTEQPAESRQVVNADFIRYLEKTPGIVVLRPR
ncbi:DUF1460 domain-containing protein [Serratia microhaemolytica]|uniref:DUF1460 domain-containing protein n=1 Tax=Serratia microhaemolytica TaxID=2675110 RepID=UPI000FDF2575|nr:DUF1460 domain-containing protein [Serratia microhaemolytica]